MPLGPGTRLGTYVIEAAVGAGGMGEVYRARDTRLGRTVALKVLPSNVSGDPASRSRLDREARAVASLNDPRICTLHDVGHSSGVDYLVFEYLEGVTLEDRLRHGPLALDQVLAIANEIAGALASAHRHGIVHRDLKPGNVMLTKSSTKLLDFGLARMRPVSESIGDHAESIDTIARTATGTLVGTLPYMAPEQLEGKDVDSRADLFAFGALVWEMATGRRAFPGESPASVIAAILEHNPPPIATIRPEVHPLLDDLVHRCLAKDPDARCQSARDIAADLHWIAGSGVEAGSAAHRRRLAAWPWIATALLVTLSLVAVVWLRRGGSVKAPPVRFTIQLPPSVTMVANESPIVSPTGDQVIFVASADRKPQQLWTRRLNSIAAEPLGGTEGAAAPFWSPDGAWIGFFADKKLKRVPASGGIPQSITEIGEDTPYGADWNRDGDIVFTPGEGSALYRVRVTATTATATPVTHVDASAQEQGHYWPQFLPDGRHFLFVVDSARSEDDGLYAGSLDRPERQLVIRGLTNGVFVQPGYLLFTRDGTLMAQRFDPGALKLSGEPFAIAERVGLLQGGGTRSLFSASRTGVVAYRGDESRVAQLTWFSRNGDKLGVLGPAGPWRAPALSPDQRSVAVVRVDNKVGDDVWVIDTLLGKATPLTSGAGWQNSPMWAPDNRYIIFSSDHNGPFNLFRKRADGVGEEEHVFSSPNWKFAMDWSPDGRFVIYQEIDPKTKLDLWALSLTDRRASTLVRTPFDEYDATFSPDGQWFAYVGEASGQPEIYVQPFGGGSGRWQASIAGGTQPIWTSGGSELVYVALDGMIMSVSVRESGSALDLASPRPLFRSSLQKALTTSLAVTRDGQRFLIPVMDEHHEIEPITVLVNATDSTR